MQVLIAISGFCPRIGNVPCTTPFDFLFVISIHVPTWGTTLSISTNLFALIFQSTFPRGERHHQPGYHYLLHSFQSTFLCGERRHITRMQLTTLHFNPRSRVGNDGWSYSDRICDRDFNPHSCVGNDTKCEKKLRSYPDFNPRSLVGNDDSKHPRHCFFSISIHVPSWGTTSGSARDHRKDRISIHFPSWGTTVLALLQIPFTMISIHVPSWGTTFSDAKLPQRQLFQSTFPRGERPIAKQFVIDSGDFNPRSLVGNDPNFIISFSQLCISIHVPSWGTTANFHKYSLFFYAINIIFLLFIIPSLFSLVLFMLLF